MSEVKWSDVKHLYLGCEAMPKEPYDRKPVKLVEIQEGGWYRVKGLYSYAVMAEKYLTPILRPLSDMTEEEGNILGWTERISWETRWSGVGMPQVITPDEFVFLLSKSFDLFNLIPSGQAISKSESEK